MKPFNYHAPGLGGKMLGKMERILKHWDTRSLVKKKKSRKK